MAFSTFNDNYTHTIELQENDEEIFRGEKYIRLRDDLVMNDQTETKTKERTVLQENGRREGLREEMMNDIRAMGVNEASLPRVLSPRTIDSQSISPPLVDRFVSNHLFDFYAISST